MIHALLLAAISFTGREQSGPVDTVVQIIEINHQYDGDGRETFIQWIAWAEYEDEPIIDVAAWRICHDSRYIPSRTRYGWESVFFDGETLRRVRSRSYNRTHSQVDHELERRAVRPCEARRGL